MPPSIRVTTLRIASAGAALAILIGLAGTGGAVAAKLITSADIKDGTIQTRDVSAPALSSFQSLQGYEIVRNEVAVAADADASLVGTCPGDKRALSVSGFFDHSNVAVVAIPLSDGTGGLLLGHNDGAADTLNIRVVCATTS